MSTTGSMNPEQLISALTGIDAIEEQVKERNGSPYVSNGLKIKLLKTRLNLVEKYAGYAKCRLENALESSESSLKARKQAPVLSELSSGLISVDVRRISGLQDTALRDYAYAFRGKLLEDPDWLKNNNLIIIDNAYGGDYDQRIADVPKGYGLDYHPSLFAISVQPCMNENDVTVLTKAFDKIIDDIENNDGKVYESVSVPIVGDAMEFTWKNKSSYDDSTNLDDSYSENRIIVKLFNPTLAGVLRMGGLHVLDYGIKNIADLKAVQVGNAKNRLDVRVPVCLVEAKDSDSVRFRII